MSGAPSQPGAAAPVSPHRHESIRIYGEVIAAPRFTFRKRMLWWALLTLARFDWGLALIRRIRRS